MCWLCLQVLRLVMTLGAAAVRGNHDDQALSAYHKFRRAERQVLFTCDLNPTQLYLAVSTPHSYILQSSWHADMQRVCLAAMHHHSS